MAEQVILACDTCGRPAKDNVKFKVGSRNFERDYCEVHLRELTDGARAPKRGRKRAVVVVAPAKRRGRPPKAASANGRKRGRPRKAA